MPQTKQSREELLRIALAELLIKIRLENTFRREITRLFNRMLEDNRQNIIANSIPVSAQRYENAWADLLINHYARVQNAFTDMVSTDEELTQEESNRIEALFLGALLAWRESNAANQAAFITRTNQENLADGFNLARMGLEDIGEPFTDFDIAASATVITRGRFQGRVGNIATTETQAAAESTKNTQTETILSVVTTLLSTKTWVTVGDEVVRDIHRAVNFLTININQVFSVGGERLRFPGDRSLGATMKNLARCRCSAVYSIT